MQTMKQSVCTENGRSERMSDLIKRSDVWNITAILHSEFITIEQEQILERIDEMIDGLPSADRPQDDEFKNFDRESLILLIECQKERIGELLADRPQGHWTKTDVATYRCSECGKIQIADDVNELNFCCCCGSRNKVRRKGANDE